MPDNKPDRDRSQPEECPIREPAFCHDYLFGVTDLVSNDVNPGLGDHPAILGLRRSRFLVIITDKERVVLG
jgi:hypothetical protein